MRLQDIMGAGAGEPEIAYDQSAPAADDIMAGAQAAAPQAPSGLGAMAGAAGATAQAPDLSSLMGMGTAPELGQGVDPEAGMPPDPSMDPTQDPAAMNDATGGLLAEVDPMQGAGADPSAGMPPESTDQLSDQDLASVDSPEAPGMDQVLEDPSLSPDDRAQLQQDILLAARRQVAGL